MSEVIKLSALRAVEDSDVADVVSGVVVGVNPLRIQIDQKIELTEKFLVLCRNVTDYWLDAVIDGARVSFLVDNALKDGESVVLMQKEGGQVGSVSSHHRRG